ncbi:MAG: hypothetical protein ABSE62_16545 [Chthoniobacteraceae bacterium]
MRVAKFVMALSLVCGSAWGAQYEVGAGKPYANLQAVAGLLQPGDVVNVQGGAIYQGGVTLAANGGRGNDVITIRGVRVNGVRPVLSGVMAKGGTVLRIFGSHYVIEGLDLTAGGDARAARCFYNVGDDVTLRDSVVHDCPFTGIAGADASGSLTLDEVEVYHCGAGLFAHQIYIGSSVERYPEALFRMRNCYVHDGTGGNNVKSRVTRNEIEYNWIEGAGFHDLDFVGPDPKSQKTPKGGVHCDADIVGNVLIVSASAKGTMARMGTDGTASSRGRYRFAYNTVIVKSTVSAKFGLFWLKGEVDSVMAWNNVFQSEAGPLNMARNETAPQPVFGGEGNWVPAGTLNVPPGWKAIRGTTPGFINGSAGDYRPGPDSPLIGSGGIAPEAIRPTQTPPGPNGQQATARPAARERDIGAFSEIGDDQ